MRENLRRRTKVHIVAEIPKKPSIAITYPVIGGTPVGGIMPKSFGVTELDGAEETPVPIAFVAVTVKVYAVLPVNPVTIIGLAVPVAV